MWSCKVEENNFLLIGYLIDKTMRDIGTSSQRLGDELHVYNKSKQWNVPWKQWSGKRGIRTTTVNLELATEQNQEILLCLVAPAGGGGGLDDGRGAPPARTSRRIPPSPVPVHHRPTPASSYLSRCAAPPYSILLSLISLPSCPGAADSMYPPGNPRSGHPAQEPQTPCITGWIL